MPVDNDTELLTAFARGDRDALGRLAARHETALLGLAMGLLGSQALACDAVQDAWVKVIRAAKQFRAQSSVKTWLYRIVINECKDLRGKRHAANDAGDGGEAGALGAVDGDREERRRELMSALDALDEPKRIVLLLCYHDGMRHEQAAEILGLPLGTLKSRLHAGLRALRERLVKGAAP